MSHNGCQYHHLLRMHIRNSTIFINSSFDEDPSILSGERCLHDDATLPSSSTAGTMLTASPTLHSIDIDASDLSRPSNTTATNTT